MSDNERAFKRSGQIAAVQAAALVLGFEERAADSIASMEALYRDHLEAGGVSGRDAAAKLFDADTGAELFWFDVWMRARQGAGLSFNEE